MTEALGTSGIDGLDALSQQVQALEAGLGGAAAVAQAHRAFVALALRGGVQALRLPVTVLPALDAPLLGMDLLGRLSFTQADGVLRLRRPPT